MQESYAKDKRKISQSPPALNRDLKLAIVGFVSGLSQNCNERLRHHA